jgi:hypothetical protein
MERLKPLSEVCEPDIRYRGRVDLDEATGMVSETTIESFYSLIQPITLGSKVPDEICNHFETARNLALYSWFVYSFQCRSCNARIRIARDGVKNQER